MNKSEKIEVSKMIVELGRLIQETESNTFYIRFYNDYGGVLLIYLIDISNKGIGLNLALQRYKSAVDSAIETTYKGNAILKYLSANAYSYYSSSKKGAFPEYIDLINNLYLGYNEFVSNMHYAMNMPRANFKQCVKYSEKMMKKSGIDESTIAFFITSMTANYTSK